MKKQYLVQNKVKNKEFDVYEKKNGQLEQEKQALILKLRGILNNILSTNNALILRVGLLIVAVIGH